MEKITIDAISAIFQVGGWARLTIAFVALAIVAYILYKNRNEKALNDAIQSRENTISAYKDEITVKNTRIETLIAEVKKADEKTKALELECSALKVKTDLTEVLKMLGGLSETFGREHTTNLEMLQMVVKNIQDQQVSTTSQLESNSKFLREIFEYIKTNWHTTSNRGRRRQKAKGNLPETPS